MLVPFIQAQRLIFYADTFEQDKKELQSLVLDGPCTVERVDVDADIPFARKEIDYLLDIKPNDLLSISKLENGFERIFQKNKFHSIALHTSNGAIGTLLTLELVGAWTFSKLKLHGISFGRDVYKQCYLMEPGDWFDESTHQLSLAKMREHFQKNGYFNGVISDYVERFSHTKTVVVHVECKQENRFIIQEVDICADQNNTFDCIKTIKQQCIIPLEKTYYDKQLIACQTAKIHELLVLNGFGNAEVYLKEKIHHKSNAVSLLWNIVLGEKRTFLWAGNTFFTEQELAKHIFSFGRSASIIPPAMLAQEIKNVYQAHGFLQAEVNCAAHNGELLITINEGERAIVDSVAWSNQADHPTIDVQVHFSQVLKQRYAHNNIIQEGVGALVDACIRDGFLDATLLVCKLHQHTYPFCSLEIAMDMGERYVVRDIVVQDYPSATQQLVDQLIDTPVFLTESYLVQQRLTLQNYFAKYKGHMSDQMLQYELKKVDSSGVRVVWSVHKGTCADIFGKTIVITNGYNAASYILPACAYKEGEPWDQEKIRKTFLSLKNFCVFDSIVITPSKTIHDGKRDVIVRLSVDDPFELRIRAGLELQQINNYHTFGGLAYLFGGTFMVKNPACAGDCLTFRTEIGRFHREIDILYQYPWPFKYYMCTSAEIYSNFYDQPTLFGAPKNIYALQQHGGLVSLERDLYYATVNTTVGIELSVTGAAGCGQKDKLQAIRLAEAINFDPLLLGKGILYVFFETSIFTDFLDNKVNPTNGSYSICSCKCMIPCGRQPRESYLVKVLAEHAQFIPFYSCVLALRLRFGHVFERKLKAISPAERFYLGGSHSLRGYDPDMVPPLGVFDCQGTELVVPRGGKSMLNANAEIRIPIWKNFDGVVFSDMGVLAGDRFAAFMAEGLVGASGFGVRYHTPMGPLRFDIGWKWRRHERLDRSYAWFLTFGQSF